MKTKTSFGLLTHEMRLCSGVASEVVGLPISLDSVCISHCKHKATDKKRIEFATMTYKELKINILLITILIK